MRALAQDTVRQIPPSPPSEPTGGRVAVETSIRGGSMMTGAGRADAGRAATVAAGVGVPAEERGAPTLAALSGRSAMDRPPLSAGARAAGALARAGAGRRGAGPCRTVGGEK